jgi:NAD(P)-dependent dehydrogenase (short-subunit alcohol dehydrogenase family)
MEALVKSFGENFRSLIIGANGGIGRALFETLHHDDACCSVTGLSRSADRLDLLVENSISAHAAKLADQQFDLIVCATGALTINGVGPEKSIKQVTADAMAAQFAINAIGPALILKHFTPLLSASKRSVFALLSARVGSIGDNRLGGWISYRSSKAALNQIVRTTALEVARKRPESVVVAIHPGTVNTPLSRPFASNHKSTEPRDAASMILTTLDGLGASVSGGFFAYDARPIEW